MRYTITPFILSLLLASSSPSLIYSDSPERTTAEEPSRAANFVSFTGKITRNKVRMRSQPTLDSGIVREFNSGDLLIVAGETEDFYAVLPPSDIKGYVFRTFILDNVVEGSRVNVRLKPDLESPIIAQLNSGEKVEGTITPLNNKWLEIAPPSSARFYVAKDYIEKIGDKNMLAIIQKRREELSHLLDSTALLCQSEMQKTFPEINLELIIGNYQKIIKNYSEFTEDVSRAKDLLNTLQEQVLQKKIAYLEAKTSSIENDWQTQNLQLAEQVKTQESLLRQLQLDKEDALKNSIALSYDSSAPKTKMSFWMPMEEKIFSFWQSKNEGKTQDEFYQQQKSHSIVLKGVLEPYTRSIKNKPGDFLLVNQANRQPIAYLYSTQINLDEMLGEEITVMATPRPNNNFAFPAYYVLALQ